MKKIIILLIVACSFTSIAQELKVKLCISDDPISQLDRVAYWSSNFENLEVGYYEIQFKISYQKNDVEIFTKSFLYRTDAIDNPNSRRNVMNQDGSWHTCLDSSDPRWNGAIPEYLFWFNMSNRTIKGITDEAFKTAIMHNLDESEFFNQ